MVSSDSQEGRFLFARMVTTGIDWSAAERRRSLKRSQQSSMESVRKHVSQGIMLMRSTNNSKSAFLKLYSLMGLPLTNLGLAWTSKRTIW